MTSPVHTPRLQEAPRPASTWIQAGFWISILISVAVVLRRVAAFIHSSQSGPPDMLQLDRWFRSHEILTLFHIIPTLLFVMVTPFVLLGEDGSHDTLERCMYALGAIVGITAYAMSVYTVGGWVERSAVLVFNSLFLYHLAKAFSFRRAKEPLRKHIALLRGVAILLGIATTRPVMGIFFATSRLTHLGPTQFFGYAFWIGFAINTIAVEFWVRARYQPILSADYRSA
jgi:hypothetical protein